MDDAVKADMKSKTVFIIANERLKKDGSVGRFYAVFPSFKQFLKKRNKFVHCHEILLDHSNNKPNSAGRLVFDFDIKFKTDRQISSNFKDEIEDTIIQVLERYFVNVDVERLKFVWSSSDNPHKLSKHLTVKHIYFDNWIYLCKIFYQLFCTVWDDKYSWIESKDLIDFQIIRKHASLRMVGSKKINGNPLILDDVNYTLEDSLIRIYFKKQRRNEQRITVDSINPRVFENVLPRDPTIVQKIAIIPTLRKEQNPTFDATIYKKAYQLHHRIQPNVFKMGKVSGSILSLIRNRHGKSHCLLSGRVHEQENSFLIVKFYPDTDRYNVFFSCYRSCSSKRSVFIGHIDSKLKLHLKNDLRKKYKRLIAFPEKSN